jgi:hypothetical protein
MNQRPTIQGFQQRQRARAKQRVLEVSQRFIAQGCYPAVYHVCSLAAVSHGFCRKMQTELQAEGLLNIPKGLPMPPKAKRIQHNGCLRARPVRRKLRKSDKPLPQPELSDKTVREKRLAMLREFYEQHERRRANI